MGNTRNVFGRNWPLAQARRLASEYFLTLLLRVLLL